MTIFLFFLFYVLFQQNLIGIIGSALKYLTRPEEAVLHNSRAKYFTRIRTNNDGQLVFFIFYSILISFHFRSLFYSMGGRGVGGSYCLYSGWQNAKHVDDEAELHVLGCQLTY